MRILKFVVNKQNLKEDPKCDFSGLVPGSDGYLRAEFSFSPEWKDCVKAVGFYSRLGKEYSPQALDEKNGCMIPAEALKRRAFGIKVIGQKNNLKIITNKLIVCQRG